MDENTQKRSWWLDEHEDNRHEAVWSVFEAMRRANEMRLADHLHFARLYGARAYDALRPRSYWRASARDPLALFERTPRLTYNIIQSVVDTKVAKLAANTPRAMFVTEGGNWSAKQDAKKLTKAGDGLAYETKLPGKELDALLDEEVFGTGVMHFYDDGEKVHAERVLPDEILVDEEEAFYGEPQNLMRWKVMSKDRAVALYATDEKGKVDEALAFAIRESCADPQDTATSPDSHADLVLVIAAWHLPSGPHSGDGCYALCVEKATLDQSDFEDDEFPFAFLVGQKRQVGFWGQGAAERLAPTQWALNKTYQTIENQLDYGAVTRILKRRGAKIPDSHIRRRRMGIDIIDVDGGPNDMQVVKAEPVSEQLLQREETLIRRGYQQEGVSEMDASAKKPAGLDSGAAQREYHDIASQRFMRLGKAFEQFHLDCIRQLLKRAKKLADKGKYEVRVPGKVMEKVDLKDIELPEDGYVMKAFPVSALPTTPAAKRQELGEWVNLGWVDQRVAMKLMDAPDLEDYMSLEAAALDDIESTIGLMLDKGEPQTPEPYQDLQTGMQWVQLAYLRARREGAPEERLDMLRDWMSNAKALMDAQMAKQAAAQPQLPPGAGSMPGPAAPPAGAPPAAPMM